MKIGSHVSFKGKTPLYDAIQTSLNNNANAMMIYTGAPQSTRRKELNLTDLQNGLTLAIENSFPYHENTIVHAPYIINLGNPLKPETREFGKNFLISELQRCHTLETTVIVLHPGSHLKHTFKIGGELIIKSLKEVFSKTKKVKIALETMAGKGSEIGRTFEEINFLLKGLEEYKDRVGVCLDTCHIHDAGYDLKNNYEQVIKEIENTFGINRILCIHVNDSKNACMSHKDRHENIGYGYLGFDVLHKICTDYRFKHLVKILETPYHNNKPPYKQEIEMLINHKFVDWK